MLLNYISMMFGFKVRNLIILMLTIMNIACQKTNTETQKKEDILLGLSLNQKEKYIEKGKSIVEKSTKSISTQLLNAIKESGIQKAISFCNVKAIPIIDSLSRSHKALIKRTTLIVRNPLDKPDSLEKIILKNYQLELDKNKELKPKVFKDEQYILYTDPIIAKPLCLNCHGTIGEELKGENYNLILSIYPNDKAIGYKTGDLRGMWSIRFLE